MMNDSKGQAWVAQVFSAVSSAIAAGIIGHEEGVRLSFATILCSGHSLYEGVPGVAKTLLVRTYASALAAYSDQRFDFRPLHARPDDTDGTVQVRIIQPGQQPVSIDYGMEKTASGWKAYDVVVGGVSLVANYRTEFGNIVRAEGIDGLIRNLHAKNQSLEQAGEQGKK